MTYSVWQPFSNLVNPTSNEISRFAWIQDERFDTVCFAVEDFRVECRRGELWNDREVKIELGSTTKSAGYFIDLTSQRPAREQIL